MCFAMNTKGLREEAQHLHVPQINQARLSMTQRSGLACLLGLLACPSPVAYGRPQRATQFERYFETGSFRSLLSSQHIQINVHQDVQNSTSSELMCLLATPSYDTLASIDEHWQISQLAKKQPHKRLLPLSKGKPSQMSEHSSQSGCQFMIASNNSHGDKRRNI